MKTNKQVLMDELKNSSYIEIYGGGPSGIEFEYNTEAHPGMSIRLTELVEDEVIGNLLINEVDDDAAIVSFSWGANALEINEGLNNDDYLTFDWL